MSENERRIYVLAIDHGCEGKTAPIQAFEDLEAAKAILRLMDCGGSGAWEIFAVPIWPHTIKGRYWDIKPVEYGEIADEHRDEVMSDERG